MENLLARSANSHMDFISIPSFNVPHPTGSSISSKLWRVTDAKYNVGELSFSNFSKKIPVRAANQHLMLHSLQTAALL